MPFAPAPIDAAKALAGAGFELAGIVVVMTLGGWWLDNHLGTKPWLLLVFAAIGVVGGLYRFILNATPRKPR
ncbi:MAG: AtpZ/AtpI family protein [Planctomycetota bacterium]|nr:AtpZ/AtpI family protein [Planctomycetota bacterium]